MTKQCVYGVNTLYLNYPHAHEFYRRHYIDVAHSLASVVKEYNIPVQCTLEEAEAYGLTSPQIATIAMPDLHDPDQQHPRLFLCYDFPPFAYSCRAVLRAYYMLKYAYPGWTPEFLIRLMYIALHNVNMSRMEDIDLTFNGTVQTLVHLFYTATALLKLGRLDEYWKIGIHMDCVITGDKMDTSEADFWGVAAGHFYLRRVGDANA